MILEIVGGEHRWTTTYEKGISKTVEWNNNSEVENPTEQQVIDAIQWVYNKDDDAVILLSDKEQNLFMQLPCGGVHIEYCVGESGPIYSHADTPIELAIQLFMSYLRCDESWKTTVEWKVEIEHLD